MPGLQQHTYICIPDRYVSKRDSPCPHCGEDLLYMGTRWRAPKKGNDRAWKRIEKGDYLWDDTSRLRTKLRRHRWLTSRNPYRNLKYYTDL
jgi:hypothetical protein